MIKEQHIRLYLLRVQAAQLANALHSRRASAEPGSPEAGRLKRLAAMADRREDRRYRARVEP